MRRVPQPRRFAAPRSRLSVALLATVVLTSLTAASCGEEELPVALGKASLASVTELVDAPGSVTARAAATLSAPADGVLRSMWVRPGQSVRAGQVLAVIDSPTARAQLERAREALAAAKRAGRGGAGGTAELTRLQRQTDQAAERAFADAARAADKITDAELRAALLAQLKSAQQQYSAAAQAANAAVRAVQRGVASLSSAMSALGTAQRLQAQQAYDLAKSTVDALTLRAPISGVVQLGGTTTGGGSADALAGLLGAAGATGGMALPGIDPGAAAGGGPAPVPGVDGTVPVGGRVSAGTPVLTVVDLTDLGVVAEVDETDVLLVHPGLAATVELDAATGASYEASVRSVDVLPTTATQGGVSYRVRLSLGAGEFPDGRTAPTPRPGMSAVVHLRVREAAQAVTVPAAAVFSADGRDTVWVIRDGRARRVAVTVGVQGQELVQIVDGVQAGQELVVSGTDQVSDGQELGEGGR